MSMLNKKMDKTRSAYNQRSSDVFSQKNNSDPPMKSNTKIHRVSFLLNALTSNYISKFEEVFHKIKIKAKRNKQKYNRMRVAINGVFRKSEYNGKFGAFNNMKRIMISQYKDQLKEGQKMFSRAKQSASKLIIMLVKSKKQQRIVEAFHKIKNYSLQVAFEKNSNKRKSIRIISNKIHKNMKWAFNKLHFTQRKTNRRFVIKNIFQLLKHHRKQTLGYSLWKLKKNVMFHRHEQVLQDIKLFQEKMEENEDPQMIALKEKREKLEENARKVQEEQRQLQESLKQEMDTINGKKQNMQKQIDNYTKQNRKLEIEIKNLEEEATQPYSLDQIFQCLYNNLLLYLHENQDRFYNKEQVINSLKTPLIPIDVPLQKIKQENEAMQQLLNEYILMFGDKRSEMPKKQIELPYEYLVKQNYSMYKMLLTLLPLAQNDKEGLHNIKDGIFKLQCKAKQFWDK